MKRIYQNILFWFCIILFFSGVHLEFTGTLKVDTGSIRTDLPEAFVVDVTGMLPKLAELRPDEHSDQIADWAVYGTLLEAGIPGDAILQAPFNIAPFRFLDFEGFFDFDYGRGRRIFLPDDSVWLFYSERDKESRATLARLADQVRMERDELPESFAVFRYRSELMEGIIHVERQHEIPAGVMFSSEYGYTEQEISNTAYLMTWLNSVDDVTHIKRSQDRLVLGGRRLQYARTDGANLEDVAALYQAHRRIADPGFSLDLQWDTEGLVRSLRQLLRNPALLIDSAIKLAEEASQQKIGPSAQQRVTTAFEVSAAFDGLKSQDYQVPNLWRQEIQRILVPIRNKDGRELESSVILSYMQLKNDLERISRMEQEAGELHRRPTQTDRFLSLLSHLNSLHRTQCARYDGSLDGTRVGMIFFYTDLLAKLWQSVAYYGEAPVSELYDFQSITGKATLPELALWDGFQALSDTRIHIGPRIAAYKGDPDDSEGLNWAHIGTQVYAARTTAPNTGDGAKPSEVDLGSVGWWDRHFIEVADYEQKYHVLNQIVKWSVIASWMAEHGILPELETFSVDRSHRFDHWYAEAEDLKFNHNIQFLPEHQWPGDTECIEIIRSYDFRSGDYDPPTIEGGVFLGSSHLLTIASQIGLNIPALLLPRVHVRKPKIPQPRRFGHDLDGPSVLLLYRAETRNRHFGSEEPRVRRLTTEMSTKSHTGRIDLHADGRSLGSLEWGRSSAATYLDWRDGTSKRDLLRRGQYIVDVEGKGLQVNRWNPSNVDDSAVQGVNIATRYQRLRPLAGDSGSVPGRVERVFTHRGPSPSARAIRVKTNDPHLGELRGFIDDGTLILERPSNPAVYTRFNDFVSNEGVHGEWLRQVASKNGPVAQPAMAANTVRGTRAASYVAEGNSRAALDEIRFAAREGNLREAVESYKVQLSNEILVGGQRSATTLRWSRGTTIRQHPGVQLRESVAQLRQNPGRAAEGIRKAVERMRGADEGIVAFARTGSKAVDDYALARLGQIDGLSPNIGQGVGLQPAGHRLHTTLDTANIKGGKKVLTRIDSLPRRIYVEDSKLLNKLDWDGAPGPSLSRIANHPDVVWEQLSTEGLGTFRPSLLLADGKRLIGREIVSPKIKHLAAAGGISATGYAAYRMLQSPVSGEGANDEEAPPTPRDVIYVLRTCDADNDGKVTDEERASCGKG